MVTLPMENNSEFAMYLQDEHFESITSKIGALLPVWHCEVRKMTFDLFLNNYILHYFFWIVI